MKTIPATKTAGVLSPSEPIPADAVRVVMRGEEYLIYEPGDVLPDDGPSRAQVLAEIWERIKAERDRRQQEGGVQVGGKWFKSNDQEVGRYVALSVLGARAPADYVLRPAWRTMADGVTADITPALVAQILNAGFAKFSAIDDAAQAHRAALAVAVDPAAHDLGKGWPETFEETRL